MAGNFAQRDRRGNYMPDERQDAGNDSRYGRQPDEDHRGHDMQGGGWSDRMRERDGLQGGGEGWNAPREDWRSGSARRGGQSGDWMNEPAGSSAGDSWRGEYGGGDQWRGGQGGRDMSRGGDRFRGYGGGDDWRSEGARGGYGGGDSWRSEGSRGGYGGRENWGGGGWEASRGEYGGPDHSRGGGFNGPQDSYTRGGMQDEDMQRAGRGGLGGMPGGWPGGRGGEQYGRGADWGGGNRYGSERGSGEGRSSQSSFRGLGPKGYQRSDERLKEVVCERLSDDDRIDASEISLEVRNGEVTLTGQVSDRSTKYRVEDLIEQCGVRDIHNNLRVQSGQSGQSGRSGQIPGQSQPGPAGGGGTNASTVSGSGTQGGVGQGSGMSDKAGAEGRGGGTSSGQHKS